MLRHAYLCFFRLYEFDNEIWRANIRCPHTYIHIHMYVLPGYINVPVWLLCCHGCILYIWSIVNKIIQQLCYLHMLPDCFIHKYVLLLKMLLLRKLLFKFVHGTISWKAFMGYPWVTIINIQLIVDILSFIFRWIGHLKHLIGLLISIFSINIFSIIFYVWTCSF